MDDAIIQKNFQSRVVNLPRVWFFVSQLLVVGLSMYLVKLLIQDPNADALAWIIIVAVLLFLNIIWGFFYKKSLRWVLGTTVIMIPITFFVDMIIYVFIICNFIQKCSW